MRNVRLLFVHQGLPLPEFVFPEGHHHFQARNAADPPADFDGSIFRMLGQFENFKTNVGEFEMAHATQKSYLLDVLVEATNQRQTPR